MQSKHSLRLWAKEERKKRDRSVDQILVQNLTNSDLYKNVKNILIYYPLNDEINILPLLEDNSKKFFLPKIDGENLLCCPYRSGEELCKSCFKTSEPNSAPEDKNSIDLAIIPALCVDKNNYRLGYGGGFYDRFLKNFSGKKVVCIPSFLRVETIFPDNFDIPIDLVIDENSF